MEKSFSPEQFEERIYAWWEKNGWFAAEDRSAKPSFTIPLPPPNVTGALHNGHALTITIEDTLIRWKRMQGFNALWMPGKDHAGIATQMVVERELAKEKISRHDLGREKFVEKIWEWKEKHGDIITTQMRRLGASPDWKRERFTMDKGLSDAVREVFVSLFEEGLIYRGTRMINWSLGMQSAVSDLESVPTERKGNLWHIRYHVAGGGEIIIATTRPETLLGDSAVAVHPDDERYKGLIGKKVKLPFVGREIPIIADSYVEKEFGSGALKVTPGHDFNDYEIGARHKLPIITVFTREGFVNEHGAKFKGQKILEARKAIVAELTEIGDLVKIEDIKQTVAICQRTETVLEPMVSDQWFVAVSKTPKSGGPTLAGAALDAVRKGAAMTLEEVDKRDDAIKIVPEGWNNTYYHWMENIRDWCISRQLWWGHQIPAWYCENKHVNVWREPKAKCDQCSSTKLVQDEDVLDTWFSSALWPFSTLGWPDPAKADAVKTFYPASVMETGFDILFFWVARMIMMGMHFMKGQVPFKRVYLHAMVRDEKGQKMSKTKGNVIDPLEIIKDYGADAFRFTLAAMAGQGRDVKLSLDRVEDNKAFCNKIWNASRFAMMRMGHVEIEGLPPFPKADIAKTTGGRPLGDWIKAERTKLNPVNQWILKRFDEAVKTVDGGFENFALNESANEVFTFIWNEFCDWYIEFAKVLTDQESTRAETQAVMLHMLEQMLRLAHPLIPYVTEEIWAHLPDRPGVKKGDPLMLQPYPKFENIQDNDAIKNVRLWKEAIAAIRTFRGENTIKPSARPVAGFELIGSSSGAIEQGLHLIRAVAQMGELTPEAGANKGKDTTSEVLASWIKFHVPLVGLVDFGAELARVKKEIAGCEKDIEHVKAKLTKPTFIEKAPKELIDEEKAKLVGFETKLGDLRKSETRLARIAK